MTTARPELVAAVLRLETRLGEVERRVAKWRLADAQHEIARLQAQLRQRATS